MDTMWITIGTILATGLVAMSVNWAQHYWAGKREVADARRKYREDVAKPVRDALNKIQTNLAWRDYMDTILNAEKHGVSLKPETLKDKEMLEELVNRREIRNMRETLVELLPLAAAITDEEAKRAAEQAFVSSVLTEETRKLMGMADKDVKQSIKQAYHKLEKFVASAD